MAKEFLSIEVDFGRCRTDLIEFKSLLDHFRFGTLNERESVLKFFQGHPHLGALIGNVDRNMGHVDRIAFEFDFFGDYAADLAVGDSRKGHYCFVEFENAAPDSIFKKVGRKASLEWSNRFEHGYSQIIDWFWKLHDLARTEAGRARFGHGGAFNYSGLLVIGRSDGLAELERQRLEWRRNKVVVDSKVIRCVTFDELYEDLRFQLERYTPAARANSRKRFASPTGLGRRRFKKILKKSRSQSVAEDHQAAPEVIAETEAVEHREE